jgi:hypothetical protein
MRFLILTLYNGENEFDSCLRSVGSQSHADREQRVFENLPKAEAHTLLYETIMEVGDRYDLFLKLDADMVLANETVLERIAGIFRRVTNLDHLVLGVKDWYTDSDIIGVHTFSNRARWSPNPSGLFTDPDPEIPGRKVMIFRPRPIAVQHGTDPTPLQAFFFGVHRAMKACQVHVDGSEKKPFAARMGWRTLGHVWRHYESSGDRRLGQAVFGADLVLRNRLPASAVNRADPDLLAAFRNLENLDSSEVHSRLEARWRHWLPRQLRWLRAVGSDMRWLIVGQLIRDFLATPVRLARHFGRLRFSRLWTRMHS